MSEVPLSDILDESKPASSVPEPVEAPKEQPAPEVEAKPVERPTSKKQAWQDREQDAQGRIRDPDTGQYVAKEPPKDPQKDSPKDAPKEPISVETKPVEPAKHAPQQEFTDKEKAFLKAVQEERGKRQELERRLAAIEATTEPAKTFWDDPEAALAKHRAEIAKESTNARLQTAEFIARQKHTDFDEKIEVFGQILQQTPGLHAQWLAAPDPAEFAYQVGKNHKELQDAGNLQAMREKIEKETEARVRTKIEAELKEKAEHLAQQRAALPPSLSEARSTGVNKPVWGGVPTLDDILTGK